jgi:predicted site-specific integrase-resolvase
MTIRPLRAEYSLARPDIITVIPLIEWCKLRGISRATARRLILAGKVKATRLSERRIGIRSDHDQEYLDACEVGS